MQRDLAQLERVGRIDQSAEVPAEPLDAVALGDGEADAFRLADLDRLQVRARLRQVAIVAVVAIALSSLRDADHAVVLNLSKISVK
eukprot:COSAG04_NODE_4508_length_2045_cov_2.396711_3_plen_85_part_01